MKNNPDGKTMNRIKPSQVFRSKYKVDTERLKFFRRGYSQQDIALAAGISMNTYVRIEHGKRMPTINILSCIADALGVGIVDLLKETGYGSGATNMFKFYGDTQRLKAMNKYNKAQGTTFFILSEPNKKERKFIEIK